jgi:tRNA modification GTPase
VAIGGVAFTFVDMAGLRATGEDPIEAIGIERAGAEIARADIVLWLGPEGEGPPGAWEIEAQCDRASSEGVGDRLEHYRKREPLFRLSAKTGKNLPLLGQALIAEATKLAPKPGETALNQRQRALIVEAEGWLADAKAHRDPLLAAEGLRQARLAFEQLTGRSSTEDVLDSLFGRFCIGK